MCEVKLIFFHNLSAVVGMLLGKNTLRSKVTTHSLFHKHNVYKHIIVWDLLKFKPNVSMC